jgi:L-fucose dehydrogenase
MTGFESTLFPAEVMTEQYQTWLAGFGNPEEELRKIAEKVPLGKRLSQAEEIASMVVFLLSPKSRSVTASCFLLMAAMSI